MRRDFFVRSEFGRRSGLEQQRGRAETIGSSSEYLRDPAEEGLVRQDLLHGVLQHRPDVAGAFGSLIQFIRPGGEIVIDVYEKPGGFPPFKYIMRPFVRPLGSEGVYRLLSWRIPPAFEVKETLCRIPTGGGWLGSLIPIGPISLTPQLIYTDEELKQVKILSALDMLSLVYDQPQRMEDVRGWFDESGLIEVELKRSYYGINAKAKRSN